jgi:hypothetical protein
MTQIKIRKNLPARSAFTESKKAKKKRFLCVFMQTDIPLG